MLLRGTTFGLVALLAACVPPAVDDDDLTAEPTPEPTPMEPSPAFAWGDVVACENSVAGFDRFDKQTAEHGIEFIHESSQGTGALACPWLPGLAAADLDRDDDLDLVFSLPDAFPAIYVNDGSGRFSRSAAERPDIGDRIVVSAGAVDLVGDLLPDIVVAGAEHLTVFENLGDLGFGPAQPLYEVEGWPRRCVASFTFGDYDGDGDLDAVLPRLEPIESPTQFPEMSSDWTGSTALLLRNDDAAFVEEAGLVPAGHDETLSLSATFTDVDVDGDLDVILGTDRKVLGTPPTALFENTDDDPPAPRFVDIGPGTGFSLDIEVMGLATADLNGDDRPDYCMSDSGPDIRCLFSEGGDEVGFFEGTLAAGLGAELPGFPGSEWVTWGVAIEDFDNDGELDVTVAAGATLPPWMPGPGTRDQPDALWQGLGDGLFEERTADVGFGDEDGHYGLVVADLARDGHPEIVMASIDGPQIVWDNPCGPGGWLTVDLVGPPGNTDGVGAKVAVAAGGRTRTREVLSLQTFSQPPSELHFGLGDTHHVDSILVTWPDGTSSAADDVPADRHVVVTHPLSEAAR